MESATEHDERVEIIQQCLYEVETGLPASNFWTPLTTQVEDVDKVCSCFEN